jgi:uracil-DNA glycosylase
LDDPLALLRLQIEWGADEALDPDPVDRLRTAELSSAIARPPPRAVPPATPVVGPTAASRHAPAERALAIAAQATSLEQLRDAIAGFDGCALRDTASNLVWAEGDPDGAALIIGEAPGRDEDRTGHPFAGADGVLLDAMLGSIGLTRSQVLLAPLLPWRPPGGRPPNAAELAICLPFLHRLIALAQSNRLLIFGNTAARTLLSGAAARRRPTPVWIELSIPGLRTALPSLVLPGFAEMQKTPLLHRNTWAGLRLLRRAIDAG